MKKLILTAACVIGIAACQTANAITYTLDAGNSALSSYAGPYGYVDVSLIDSTHATVTFTTATPGTYTYLFGGQGVVDVNVNATSWLVSSLSGVGRSGGTYAAGDLSNGGSQNISSFGTFNQTFDNFDGYGHSVTSVSFSLTDLSGNWASDASVLDKMAAHIFVGSNPLSDSALVTGYATTGGSSVPDGGTTVLMLGAAISGLGLIARRIKK